jgi:penicillin amidase
VERTSWVVLAFAVTLLCACSGGRSSEVAAGNVTNTAGAGVNPALYQLKAETSLPPGQSGFFSTTGQLQGSASGKPGDYGAHVDDQRLQYWSFGAKPGALGTKPGTPVSPKAGVQIYRDAYGVPIVYADVLRDAWYGIGYAVAQDRLFLMDAVRRMGAGTFAELTGCGAVPGDIQQRTLAYTDAEYQAFFDRLSQDSKDAALGYLEGANAWRLEAISDPSKLPAEYALLTTTPTAFTLRDLASAGVFITRFVAAEGGNEFLNIQMLKELQKAYGSAGEAKKAFQDMVWLEDPKAVTSVPRSMGTFPNQPEPAAGRDAIFNAMADWAVKLPETIWKGPGTGAATAPVPCSQPSGPGSLPGVGMGAGGEVLMPVNAKAARKLTPSKRTLAARDAGQSAIRALYDLRAHLHGGSMAYAIGPTRTKDGDTLMVSGPQLGYSYPLLLVEFEIHSGKYHARGSSVPILPAVGIGYTADAAWGLTTGYSKTIDSFIETICSTAQIGAGTCKADQYFHNSQWKDMSCRSEVFNYRAAQKGVPVGPPNLTSPAKICRTVHGPIVARDDSAGLARSVQYAMFMHELDSLEGVREWSLAKTFADFKAATAKVTWNENVTVATRDGHIAYFHPGLFPARNANTDMRFPAPGTGEYDMGANLPFERLPHAIDPPQGYVANWNTKPAFGWLDGEGLGSTSRPGGAGQRVTSILDFIAIRNDWTFADLASIDRHHGTTDHRAREFLPVIQSFRSTAAASLSDVQKAALDLMLGWDRSHFGPGIDLANDAATDGPAATIFGVYVIALRDELFAPLKNNVLDPGISKSDPNNPSSAGLTIFGRVSGVGSHLFDQSVMDNLVLRILNPSSSGLVVQRDYTGGRARDAVMLAALNKAMQSLATQFNSGTALASADLVKCRRIHPRSQLCSLSGVIGPGSSTVPGTSCVTMPYEDRGSWVHRAGFERS